MTDVVSKIEAVIAKIETRTPHTDKCCESVTDGAIKCDSCYCDRADRLRAEIARTVVRFVNTAGPAYQSAAFANQMARMGVFPVREAQMTTYEVRRGTGWRNGAVSPKHRHNWIEAREHPGNWYCPECQAEIIYEESV